MTGPCVGCGRTAEVVKFRVAGAAADYLGVHDGHVVDEKKVCPRCVEASEREVAQLHGQRRRLEMRGFEPEVASRMITRRVTRYFRNGTFLSFKRRAVD